MENYRYPFVDPYGTVWAGISLRDSIAESAMQTIIDAKNYDGQLRYPLEYTSYLISGPFSESTDKEIEEAKVHAKNTMAMIAKLSYQMADAMLTEREKPCQTQP